MTRKLRKAQEKVRGIILERLSEYNLPSSTLVEDVPMKKGQISLQTMTDENCIIVKMHRDIVEGLVASFAVRENIAREITEDFSNYRYTGDLEQHVICIHV